MVDEIFDFFLAASQTTQAGSQSLLSFFIKNRDGLKKARSEFDAFFADQLSEDSTLENLSRLDRVHKLVNANSYDSFDYMEQVVKEMLRFRSPVPATSHFELIKDCRVADYDFKKGDKVCFVMHHGLHHNTKQW